MNPDAHLTPNDLLLFAKVVEFGSFTAAAEHLGLPKSTLSRRISSLEEQLGERLLRRTTRRLNLTEFGHGVLAHARQIDAETQAATALAAHRQARPRGRLRVSMPGDFANLLLIDLVAAFAELHPDVSLDIDLSPRRVDLIAENFDLALRMGTLPDDATLAARRIAVLNSGLFASPDYLRRRGMPADPSELAGHDTLCLPTGDGTPHPWPLQHGEQHVAFAPNARVVANSPETLLRLARAGAGIAASPTLYAEPLLNRNELVRVLPDWQLPASSAWAVFPGRRLMPAKTRSFIEMLEHAFGSSGEDVTGRCEEIDPVARERFLNSYVSAPVPPKGRHR
ncbi:MAG: LysR substrate-binding domain-containing protein [Rhodocyclaceae bacterium]